MKNHFIIDPIIIKHVIHIEESSSSLFCKPTVFFGNLGKFFDIYFSSILRKFFYNKFL